MYATKPSSFQDLKVKIINVISGIAVNHLANNLFSVNCEIVLPFALLMMEETWKLK